jgi:hypothetical protein
VLLDKNKTYWKQRVQVDEQELLVPGLPARTEEEEYHKSRVFIPVEGLNRIRQENLSQHAFMMAAWSAFLGVLFEKTSIQFGNVVSLRDDGHYLFMHTLTTLKHLSIMQDASLIRFRKMQRTLKTQSMRM